MNRRCPFPHCLRMIPPHLFGCRQHWFSLTKSQQARIYEAYEKWKRGTIVSEELRAVQRAVILCRKGWTRHCIGGGRGECS